MEQQETPAPPAGILLTGHFVERLGYHARRRAGTRDWLIFYTHNGEGHFRLGELRWKSVADDIVLLAPGVPHDYAASSAEAPWDFYWAHFLPRPHWSTWLQQLPQERPGLYRTSIVEIPVRQRFQQAWERVIQDNRLPGAYQDDLALNALEEVLLLISRHSAGNGGRTLDPRIGYVLQRLSEQLSKPPSVAEMAQSVSLSPSRLAHLFKEQTGDSIAATLLKLRLRHAARLLEFTGLQSNEIALQTGFTSAFHFSRQFKLYYGVSPTVYRSQRS